MDLSALHSNHLQSLQSSDELGLLDAIDSLRSQGLSHYVALPQLIVCGDQSSGKSSVLEAISGVPFPTKDNLCTRFATELILRRAPTTGMSIAIVPSLNRSEAECERLSGFRETLATFDLFPDLLEKAKEHMGISTTSAFSDDVLRIEISGPDRPHLTIVDLPGLIHSENKLQTAGDVALVLSMVQRYMANRRSIIMAVVSAKNDYANQIVTKLAKDVDRTGYRTLGIITKPDTLPVGSESEVGYANLARNREVEFRLGWHMLRNRDYVTRNASSEDRDRAEEEFFSQGIWRDFPRDQVGITSLRARLSRVLLEQIREELPSLSREIEANLQETQDTLQKLGTSRANLDEQRLFLLQVSQSFQSIVRAAIDGTYGDTFFGDPRSIEGYSKRLRAVVQNLNLDFAETMRTKGHRRQIVDHAPRKQPGVIQSLAKSVAPEPEIISRVEFLDEVTELLKRSRGRELPGMFNPLIVGDLFHEQSSPWEHLAHGHLTAVWDASRAFLELTICHLTDEATADALFREIIDPLMEQRLQAMREKVAELLAHHQKGHPITYNHYFTETIQNMREKRLEEEVARRLTRLYGGTDITSLEELPLKKIKTTTLISALASRNEADMDRYASSEVLDCMQAYYKVAMKSIVDSIAVQAVESLLVGSLGDILSPARVVQMKTALISKLATESPDNTLQRESLLRKAIILQAGIVTCKQYTYRRSSSLQRRAWISEHMSSEEDLDSHIYDTESQSAQGDEPERTPTPPPAIPLEFPKAPFFPSVDAVVPERIIEEILLSNGSSQKTEVEPPSKKNKKDKKAKKASEDVIIR